LSVALPLPNEMTQHGILSLCPPFLTQIENCHQSHKGEIVTNHTKGKLAQSQAKLSPIKQIENCHQSHKGKIVTNHTNGKLSPVTPIENCQQSHQGQIINKTVTNTQIGLPAPLVTLVTLPLSASPKVDASPVEYDTVIIILW
jgi:hypothetical protein